MKSRRASDDGLPTLNYEDRLSCDSVDAVTERHAADKYQILFVLLLDKKFLKLSTVCILFPILFSYFRFNNL